MMLEVARVSSKGQITVPIDIRKRLGVKEGDKVAFIEGENGITIVNAATVALDRVQKAFEGVAERLGLKDEDDVVAMIKQFRRENN
ncbi:MAG: AbrB/MazE/SpoVT family DNA-binding domain-containing protein [Thermoguttaceae bacterium]|nr:AbrB/MazE/SpoVT family DNA-binding domain-containing protein [Thermoguttaceae bacterium]